MTMPKIHISSGAIAVQLLLLISFPDSCFAHGEETVLYVAGLSVFHVLAPFFVRKYVKAYFLLYLVLYVAALAIVWRYLLASSYRLILPYLIAIGVPLIYWLVAVILSRYMEPRLKK